MSEDRLYMRSRDGATIHRADNCTYSRIPFGIPWPWADGKTVAQIRHVSTKPLDHYRGTAFSTTTRTVWADGRFAGTVACKRSRLSGDVVWQAFAWDGRPLIIIRSGFHRAGYDAAWTVIHELEVA